MSKLKVYWFGYGGNSWIAEKYREMIEDELGMKLVTIHEHPNADVQWNLSTVFEELKKADIILVPANYRRQPCKSNNRLTQAMALGKPIICDPMPAYKKIVRHLENAIITYSGNDDEYRLYLKMLRDDPQLRTKLGEEALITAREYTKEKIALKWLAALANFKPSPNIDVIIPTKNNPEILDECLKSFSNSTNTENIYIIDNGSGVEELCKKYNVPVEVVEV